MSDEPRWKLADGTEVGIGGVVWQVGHCLSRRILGAARFSGARSVAVDGDRRKFYDLGEVWLSDLCGTRRAAMEETLKRREWDLKKALREVRKAEKDIAALRAELKSQEELQVTP